MSTTGVLAPDNKLRLEDLELLLQLLQPLVADVLVVLSILQGQIRRILIKTSPVLISGGDLRQLCALLVEGVGSQDTLVLVLVLAENQCRADLLADASLTRRRPSSSSCNGRRSRNRCRS